MKRLVIVSVAALFATSAFAQSRIYEGPYRRTPAYGGGTAGNVPGTANDLGRPSGIAGQHFDTGGYGLSDVRPNQNQSRNGSAGVPTWSNNAAPIGSTGTN